MLVKLSTPIKPGFRRPLTLTPDSPVDALEGGGFATATVTQGDSKFEIRPESTNTKILAYAYGDGAIGSKEAQVRVDGHVGEGDVPVTIDIAWEVAHPDATGFGAVEEGPDEPIPA